MGCSCPVCVSTEPRNNRTRSSLFISTGEIDILVDSGPDLREQALREGISNIDAVLYTHSHLDHVVGFDELRAFCWGKPGRLPLYATVTCLDVLKNMFGWAFAEDNTHRGYVKPDPKVINPRFSLENISITCLPVVHGTVETIGFLFETRQGYRFAYIPDVKSIPEETLALMSDLDLLIIDTLREHPHSTHLSLSESCEISSLLAPQKTLFTHISHDLDHNSITDSLPEKISLAYDGLRIPMHRG
ncbi:MAG: MBL fold metallo-hydrolase [Armatimonadetes bacterium]|nr:MBL fold metallo-hydrolase [Akkermansiaceae bacterium]